MVIWNERNRHIFSFECLDEFVLITKIDHLLIGCCFAVLSSIRSQLEASIPMIKRNLIFVDSRASDHTILLALDSESDPPLWMMSA